MKTCYLYSSPSGIELIEGDKMPVRPVKPPDEIPTHAGTLCIGGDVFGYDKAMKKYEAALQAAKASGIPVEDQERGEDMIIMTFDPRGSTNKPDPKIKPGEIYGPFDISYEIVYNQKNQELVGMFMQLPTHEKIGICKNMGYNSTYYQEGKTLQDSDKDFFIWIAGNKRTNELKAIVPPLFEEWHLRAYQKPYKSTSRVAILLSESKLPEKEEQDAFLLHLIDVTACYVMEQNMYIGTPTRKELIKKARETFTITRKQ